MFWHIVVEYADVQIFISECRLCLKAGRCGPDSEMNQCKCKVSCQKSTYAIPAQLRGCTVISYATFDYILVVS